MDQHIDAHAAIQAARLHVSKSAEVHFDRARHYESRLLSAGRYDPIALNNAALEHGVTGETFGIPGHSWLFAALCIRADNALRCNVGDNPRFTIAELRELCRLTGQPFPEPSTGRGAGALPDDLGEILHTEKRTEKIPGLAAVVKQLHDRRTRALELYNLAVAELTTLDDRLIERMEAVAA